MEQLAERRMAREEEASAAANGHSPMSLSMQQAHAAHNHPQPEYDDDEDYDEEDDDEEYDDEEEEEDEPDTMTEEQRMEEGRRMFQIFAARMFEQRVLTAYREKVARERQSKLLEELEEENRQKKEREEKKAKDKDKKKERKRIQRQAKEEERQRKEAEKAAEELKLREIESQKAEELKKRKEEQKQKRDLEKKAQDEERQRKEEERRRRIQEEKEREMERERKRKEHQERERKKKEDAARKMKEEKEAREKEAREKKEQAEKEKKQRDAKAKKDAVEKERKRKEDEAKAKQEAAVVAAARRTQTSAPSTLSQSQSTSSVYGSPHLAPAIPKQTGASPGPRSRQTSQQGSIHNSQGSSPKTPNIPPRLNTSASPGTPIPQHNASGPMHVPNKVFGFPMTTGITPTSPLPHFIAPPPGVTPPESAFGSMGMTSPMQAFLPNMGQRQSIGNGIPMYPPGQSGFGPSPQFRGFGSPNGIPMQIPTAPGMRSMSGQGRGGFMGDMSHQLPPGVPLPPPGSPFIGRAEPVPMSGHSRAPSGSFEPIHRPTPIQRPSSVAPPKSSSDDTHSGIDELSKVMGSRALLEDDDVDSLPENMSPSRRTSNTQFAPRPIRGVPISSPHRFFTHTFKEFGTPSWSNPMPLGGSLSGSLPSAWANGWSETDAARSTFNRRRQGRIDQIRIITCEKCRELGEPGNQFVEFGTLQRAIQGVAPHDLIISSNDIADVLDIEGDPQNGGGTFKVSNDASGRTLVQYEPDQSSDLHRMSVGEIGSPGTQGAVPFRATPLGPPGMASSPAGF
ncbi:hypothetical protein EDC01DRAFT_717848 [Geopyxis carbonaria]|nr:hypothetical protein EDC01DRAFT_717848 [Geopyxis carbonaria]